MTLQLKNPHLLLYIVLPCIFAVTYAIVALDELKHAVIILCLCVLFTSLLLSLLFLEHSNPSSREEELKRNVYKVFDAEGVEATFRRLVDGLKAHRTDDGGVDLDVLLSYLKTRVFKDKKGETASVAVRMGAIELCLTYLNSTTTHSFHPKTTVRVVELFTAILSHREVRFQFFSAAAAMKSTVSSFAAWFKDRAMLWLSLVDAIEAEEREKASQLFKHMSSSFDSLNPTAVPLPVGYSLVVLTCQLTTCVTKSVIALGQLVEDCPEAQSLATECGMLRLMLRCLDRSNCAALTIQLNDYVKSQCTVTGDADSNESCFHYYYHAMQLAQWTCWSLFIMTFDHRTNQADLFQYGGVRLIIDTMKRNAADSMQGKVSVDNRTKSSRMQLFRQALAILLNILTFPGTTVGDHSSNEAAPFTGSYSVSKARQAMIANDIHDVIEQNKKWFAAEKDILATSNAILGHLMHEWY